MNKFVSLPELMQSRKDKTNSYDNTERFLFSLFDSSTDGNSRKSMHSKVVFLIASDWCSSVIVTNVFLHLVQAKPEFVYQNCVKLIGHGGAHKHSCALKSLFIQNTSSITNFLPTSLTTCYEVKN